MRLAGLSARVTGKGVFLATSLDWPMVNGAIRICCGFVEAVVISMIVSILLCSNAAALEVPSGEEFIWQIDKSTGAEVAASQGSASINYFDAGDLSASSLYLVQQVLGVNSNAAGMKIDRSLNRSSIAIFHDTNVFLRLKNDAKAFTALGIPDDVLEDLKQRVTDEAKCISTTRTDANNNIVFTVILLSEKFNECLIGGLNNAFGLRSLQTNIRTLIGVCVLYEARRRGIRDRQSLSQEIPRLRELCISKAGEDK